MADINSRLTDEFDELFGTSKEETSIIDEFQVKKGEFMGLREKIIKEQDFLCMYFINDKSVSFGEMFFNDPEYSYIGVKNYILKNIDILDDFETKNLFSFLHVLRLEDAEIKNKIVEKYMKRLENEKFFCEEIDFEAPFGMTASYSGDGVFNVLGNENIEKIKDGIRNRLNAIDNQEIKAMAFKRINRVVDVSNFLKYYEEGKLTNDKIELIKELDNDGETDLKYINFGVFQDDILDIGVEFIKYISKFPYLSTSLVNLYENNPKLFECLKLQIKKYEKLPDNYEEIDTLLSYLYKNAYNINVDVADEKIADNLLESALLNSAASKVCSGIIPCEYSNEFDEDLERVYDEEYEKNIREQRSEAVKIKNVPASSEGKLKQLEYEFEKSLVESTISRLENDKKNIYMNKRFSISIVEAEKLLNEYARDVENIELSDEIRGQVDLLRETLEVLKEVENVDELYKNVKKEMKPTEILKLKKELSNAFAKDYISTFKKVDEKVNGMIMSNNPDEISKLTVDGKEIDVVKFSGEFNMLVHSSDANFVNAREIAEDTNFAKYWETGADKSNHIISTAYMTNNFMGCAPVGDNGVMYAFTAQNADKIKLMGITDINTYMREFAYNSKERQYMSAKTMDVTARRVYSEFALEREGTNPNYVILFDDMDEAVKKNTYKAASDFGIPVLYIDKKEIVQQQLSKLDDLIKEFDTNKNPEILKSIINTYETNVAGWLLNRSDENDNSFTQGIDNSRFKNDFDGKWKDIDLTIKNYIETARENSQDEELARIIEIILEERDLYEKCEEVKPISKTHLSFDANEILQNVNETLDSIGKAEMKVDLEKIPKAQEYKKLRMREIAQVALRSGITDRDVEKADKLRNKSHEKGMVR